MILVFVGIFIMLGFFVALFFDIGTLPLGKDLLIPDSFTKKDKPGVRFLIFTLIGMFIQLVLEVALGWISLIWWPGFGLLFAVVLTHSWRLALLGLAVFAFLFYFPSDQVTLEDLPYWKNQSEFPSHVYLIQKRDAYFAYSFFIYQWDQDAKDYLEVAAGQSCIHVKPRLSHNPKTKQLDFYTRGWWSKITLIES